MTSSFVPEAPPGGTEGRAARAAWFSQQFSAIQQNVESFIRGKGSVVELALVCLTAEGHVLVDDIPGVGKTSMAKAIAKSIDGQMSRIQFTPDLLPSDVSGTDVFDQRTQEFRFHPGPVFSHIVVGDEINRASPKTQSAMLEVMEERQVTADGTPYLVPRPFLVMATQNPVEFDGTYHLPEAQIDRFMMRISIGYPDHASEVQVIRDRHAGSGVDQIKPVIDTAAVQSMITIARETYVAPSLEGYVVTICAATRRLPELRLGVSPRGSLALIGAAQALAASRRREFVTADDIKYLAPHVLGHRMLMTAEAELNGHTAESLLKQITASVPLPEDRD
jgi:MoxR-like ATPase